MRNENDLSSSEVDSRLRGNDKSNETPVIHAPSVRPLEVRLEVYEGPLDLLLDIIRKNEIDIFNIPMAKVTEQYMEYLNTMKMLNLDIAGEFLVLAATLVYIKSRMILPQEAEKAEDEGQDPREELVRKLLEYQAFKEAAKELGTLEAERSLEFTRKIADHYFKDLSPEDVQIDSLSANLYDLVLAFHKVLKSAGHETFHEVLQEVITIEEKIEEIKQILAARAEVNFLELFPPESSRNELIVTFLAILELAKSKFIRIVQKVRFGDIMIAARQQGEVKRAV
ncbi:MAG: segregation/condensation protein A [Candidatus Omnitrophica bacterium]|nr:segregation/condensation protein A [Candidatus Omnitrophota bacterium]